MTAPLFMVVTTAMIVLGALTFVPSILENGFGGVVWALIPYLAAILLAAVFIGFRVTVDWRGLRVTSLLFAIPLKRIAPDQIATVHASDLRPMEWGGWGYRITAGRSAIILRGGPGLVVTMITNKQFALTLDNPEEPASILLALQGDGLLPTR